MMRFEGKYGIHGQVLWMVEFDMATRLVHVHDATSTRRIGLDDSRVYVPGGDPYLYALVYGLLGDPSPEIAWVMNNPANFGEPGESSNLIAPGVSQMQRVRLCESADFSPFRGIPVDFSDADLSGVMFGNIDFRPAIVQRTRFRYAALNRCTFGSGQLAGLDLSHATLERANLGGFDLTGTTLDGAVLLETNFTEATLENASLRGAQLDDATFDRAKAGGAAFDGAIGIGMSFAGATLANATFERARFGQPEFAGAKLAGASFKNALLGAARFAAKPGGPGVPDLSGVDFDNADLMGADFTGVDLTVCKTPARPPRFGQAIERRTRFVRAKLASSFLGNDWSYIDATDAAISIDASIEGAGFKAVHAILPKIAFAGRHLAKADFRFAHLREARFGGCVLTEAKFGGGGTLEGVDFTDANLEDAHFIDADLKSAVFAQAWMYGARFEGSDLSNTNFSSAMLAQVNFTGIKDRRLAGVNFARACLVSADFRNVGAPRSDSTRTTFSGACLAGANFSAAALGDVILTGAQLSAGDGTIVVSHRFSPNGRTFRYRRTSLAPDRTGTDTTCPDGHRGQCSIERLTSVPVPDEWYP